ncbi:unnamed protein product [Gongylonema pulchrum]|uniref:His-tRNA synthetase n=1 Tax=Gongylonema pulchrum TaxID=637853 RepID=A0A3P6P605_9BILA|nr:unnamed protein product [Gongylonema pulchrum]
MTLFLSLIHFQDFDIAGTYDLMIPEAELLRIVHEIFSALDVGSFEIKVNHRQLLDGMLAVCGIPKKDFKTVCSSIDKLDKVPWEDIRNELCSEKCVQPEMVDKLATFIRLRGSFSLSVTFLLRRFIHRYTSF